MMRIIKNDTVKVISGNHKGKVGKVLKVFPKTRRIVVEKVALVKRHRKPRSQTDQGGKLQNVVPGRRECSLENVSSNLKFKPHHHTMAQLEP